MCTPRGRHLQSVPFGAPFFVAPPATRAREVGQETHGQALSPSASLKSPKTGRLAMAVEVSDPHEARVQAALSRGASTDGRSILVRLDSHRHCCWTGSLRGRSRKQCRVRASLSHRFVSSGAVMISSYTGPDERPLPMLRAIGAAWNAGCPAEAFGMCEEWAEGPAATCSSKPVEMHAQCRLWTAF